jgi:hypothetical protein
MTKTLRGFGLISALTMASAGAWLACGDDTSNGTTPPEGGTEAGSSSGTASSSGSGSSSGVKSGSSSGGSSSGSSGSSSGSGSSSSSSGAGSDAGDAGAAVSCATYCATIQSACTGANQQYASDSDGGSTACMNACKYFDMTDASNNTLACHNEHANNAIMAPVPHCWHAGPYGWGVCGDQCGDFCNLAVQYCSPAGGFSADAGQPPYPSLASCQMACGMFTMNGDDSGAAMIMDAGDAAGNSFNANGPTSGNTLDCREYHLSAALVSPANQQVHCLHPGVNSPTCM